ncbi:hypothetical protein HUJ04_005808 [Dendroctonus ponderosae]|nr:hypothetical protein HUJ04_005808 [Dendroctonus ponderosae]
MPKREHERKLRKEQEATAHVFQEFVKSFQEAPMPSKTFVKSGVLFADKNELKPLEIQLYKPTPLIKASTAMPSALECAKLVREEPKRGKVKPKSNLELLKEELKQRHSEKGERDKLKEELIMSGPALSYFDGGDPNSTNLFVANLNTDVTEANLMEEFGIYGPLASVKIMWPRGKERFKNMNTNCGFVAFMSRRDAERALNHMKNRIDMRVGWGKSVDLPTHPVFIPPELLKLYLPPPSSGLPFNAQPSKSADWEGATVKVTIPLNKKLLALINRMVEFVVKEGPLFEAMIMNKELSNPEYSFLFDNKSANHVWKLFSVLQADSTREWRLQPFRMFVGGSIWLPPVAPNYQAGMPEELVNSLDSSSSLSNNQCERLIEIIQSLNLSRSSIAEAMVFCLNHSAALKDSLDIITESLCNPTTRPARKLARVYLLSDVLSNCANEPKGVNIQAILEQVFNDLKSSFAAFEPAEKTQFGPKVLRVLRHLDTISFLTSSLYAKFQADFKPTSEEPLDEKNLLKNIDKPKRVTTIPLQYFVPSKWDTVDPEDFETQSMSSSKLYYLELLNERNKQETSIDRSKARKRKSDKSPARKPINDKKRKTPRS